MHIHHLHITCNHGVHGLLSCSIKPTHSIVYSNQFTGWKHQIRGVLTHIIVLVVKSTNKLPPRRRLPLTVDPGLHICCKVSCPHSIRGGARVILWRKDWFVTAIEPSTGSTLLFYLHISVGILYNYTQKGSC